MNRQIIVANVDNESMLGDINAVPPHIFESTSIISNRLLWLARTGDVIILPREPSNTFLKYIESINGVNFSDIKIIVPTNIGTRRASITNNLLLSETVLTEVKETLYELPTQTWQILPYYFTSAVGQFGRELAKYFSLMQPPFNAEGGAEILNQKAIFRKLAAGISIPFATGETIENTHALNTTITRLLAFTGNVIVKQDKNAGGYGNYVITTTNRSHFKGAGKVLSLTDNSMESILSLIRTELATKGNEALTIEVYYNTSTVIYSEYFLGDDGTVEYLNHGIMRMQPLWSGFEIPGHLKPKIQAELIHNSTKLALLAKSLGYKGHLNIDAIVTENDTVIFTEINGRTGGCTHVHTVSAQLLGPNYLNTHQSTTYNRIIVENLEAYLNLLSENQINFSTLEKKGVVILSSDQHEFGTTLELIFTSQNTEETLRIENLARGLASSIENHTI